MRPVWLRRGDLVVVCVVLTAALLSGIGIWFHRAPAVRVSVQYPDGSSALFSLEENRRIEITGNNHIELVVQIADGRVRVEHSDCPDQVCVHSGWLSRSGQAAACVPAGVCVRLISADNMVDGVTA